MKKEKKEESFLKQPYFEGGDTALKAFISKNIRYPKQALEHKIEGSIPLTYDINYKGEVTDVRLFNHLGHGCDEEAVRLVKMLKFVVPKVPRHLRVTFHKKLTIHFRLPEETTAPLPQTGFQIVYTTSSPKQEPAKPTAKPSVTYTYTLGGS
jgi:TonB family protein